MGSFNRRKAAAIAGYKKPQAISLLKSLLKAGLLVSDTPKSPMRLDFPVDVVDRYFPKLYSPVV